jgi:phage terminase large subunit GpA-like protein
MAPLMADIAAIRKRALACLTPPPRLALSAWIENEIWLAEGLTAVPGPMRLYPQQRGIADAIGDSGIPRVTVLKASRVGYTALLVSAIGNYCINDPSPVLALLPVESDCKDFVKSDLEPLFAASPALQGVFADESRVGQRGKRRDTILSRFFSGGSLKIIASKSPRNLRRQTARALIVDKVDAVNIAGKVAGQITDGAPCWAPADALACVARLWWRPVRRESAPVLA